MSASETPVGEHPSPQLAREDWESLDGQWQFAFDDADAGIRQEWNRSPGGADWRSIIVPFAPESRASGIVDTGYHRIVWYRKLLTLPPLPVGRVRIIHFDAVDHSCQVWVDGELIGTHRGGHTPFALPLPAAASSAGEHTIVVRATDDPHDLAQPRGKQDWLPDPHSVWYTRTTGIWRSVWLESAAALHITSLDWVSDLVAGTVRCTVTLSGPLPAGSRFEVSATLDGEPFARAETDAEGWSASLDLRPAALRAGQERESVQWSPEHPVLIDATLAVTPAGGEPDTVASYFGVRTADTAAGRFQLNGVPYFVRAVLEQCYWPDTVMTAPSDTARRREIELARALGFNAIRVHQTVADARFLYWADRLGVLVWAEAPAAYEFSSRAIELFTAEWTEIVAHCRAHPSVVTWVPMNESWGVQDVSRETRQRDYVAAIAALTRALDGTRPVISNDGWEHVDSDIVTIHDYESNPGTLRERYARRTSALAEPGPQGRVLLALTTPDRRADETVPIMVSEFGGILFAPGRSGAWGYSVAGSEADFTDALRQLFGALNGAPAIAGYCYTQLTDTEQEANGLLTAGREPKAELSVLREIVTGVGEGDAPFSWPPVADLGASAAVSG